MAIEIGPSYSQLSMQSIWVFKATVKVFEFLRFKFFFQFKFELNEVWLISKGRVKHIPFFDSIWKVTVGEKTAHKGIMLESPICGILGV